MMGFCYLNSFYRSNFKVRVQGVSDILWMLRLFVWPGRNTDRTSHRTAHYIAAKLQIVNLAQYA